MIKSITLAALFLLAPATAHSAAMSDTYRGETIPNWLIIGIEYEPHDFVCDASFSDGKHTFAAYITHKNNVTEYEVSGQGKSWKSSKKEIKHLLTSPFLTSGKLRLNTKGSNKLWMSLSECVEQHIKRDIIVLKTVINEKGKRKIYADEWLSFNRCLEEGEKAEKQTRIKGVKFVEWKCFDKLTYDECFDEVGPLAQFCDSIENEEDGF